ncbi:hypothetical protein MN116_003839 [Schistosoma mekongi]|uniref:Programmed cell death protein 10 dimerisation domain-containing protein n=1 Tax=Schistosoma mekongi TaxID=38744 RepID=A0AAE2D657_SCHME|nr:hypothetical protein MN116_003839 [Schistosoma mekongi]
MPGVLRTYESCDCVYNFALLCIFDPTFLKLSNFNSTLTNALRLAFIEAENQHPGFCEQFIIRLLLRLGISESVNLPKTYLRIAGSPNQCGEDVENTFINQIEYSARALKSCLSRIPGEIYCSSSLTLLIREIAETTKNFLDSFSTHNKQISNQRILCKLKLEFIQSCRKFSETLKMFHQDKNQIEVVLQANQLILCTNAVLDAVHCSG